MRESEGRRRSDRTSTDNNCLPTAPQRYCTLHNLGDQRADRVVALHGPHSRDRSLARVWRWVYVHSRGAREHDVEQLALRALLNDCSAASGKGAHKTRTSHTEKGRTCARFNATNPTWFSVARTHSPGGHLAVLKRHAHGLDTVARKLPEERQLTDHAEHGLQVSSRALVSSVVIQQTERHSVRPHSHLVVLGACILNPLSEAPA